MLGVGPQPRRRALLVEGEMQHPIAMQRARLAQLERERDLAVSQWDDLGEYEIMYVQNLDRQIRRLRWALAVDTGIWPLYGKNAPPE